MPLPLYKPFNSELYVRYPTFPVEQGIAVARELCERFPKVSSALVKQAKDHLQRVGQDAALAVAARSRQSHLISAEESKILDVEMLNACAAMLGRLDANTRLPGHPGAKRSEELINRLFYPDSDRSDFLQDTYAAQLTELQRMLQCIAEDELEKDLDALCGEPFLDFFRRMVPRYQNVMNALQSRGGEPIVNLLVHRNALSRAVLTYTKAICMTANDDDQESVHQAHEALDPLWRLGGSVNAGRGRQAASTAELPPTWRATEAPLPA